MQPQISGLDLPEGVPFDYQLAMDRLKDYSVPRNKLMQLCNSGQVIRLKPGLYVRAPAEEISPLVLAGVIYGPSYISLETALSYYGLIPERIVETTSICLGKASRKIKRYQTPVGRFSFRPVNERVFSFGVRLESDNETNYFIAEPEKALCDRVALVRGVSSLKDIYSLLADDLRVEIEHLETFNKSVVTEIAERYRRQNVRAFARWLSREFQ